MSIFKYYLEAVKENSVKVGDSVFVYPAHTHQMGNQFVIKKIHKSGPLKGYAEGNFGKIAKSQYVLVSKIDQDEEGNFGTHANNVGNIPLDINKKLVELERAKKN